LRQRFAAASVSFFNSGRSALCTQLERWKGAGRDEVVVPAYTCWSVAASIARAGLKLSVVDIDPDSLDYDGQALDKALGPRTLAVMGTHLFARTADIGRLVAVARPLGIKIVDDAAQALPLQPEGADVTLLSFGRGKPIALGGGGALLVHRGHQSDSSPSSSGWLGAGKLAATTLLAHPNLYRLPRSLPFLGIGQTEYEPQFKRLGSLYGWQRRLGILELERYTEMAARRTTHANELIAALEPFPGWRVPALEKVRNAPLRLPLLAPDRSSRDRFCERIHEHGVSAVPMYPTALPRIAALRQHLVSQVDCPGGDELAARLVTLPTYPTLSSVDRRRLVQALVTTLEEMD
jgi:dTDP-4-amino-4,6-dideoxygalactose transaminase